ncbi:MAG: hypothetical protein SNH35_08740 [Rikenellaceae bacterium]
MSSKQPSYVEYINNFWRADESEHFTPVQSRLYFLLLSIFNRKHWCDEVAISDGALCDMVGVSLNTLKRAKAELIERGIITLTRGGRGFATKTRYQLRCEDRGQSRGQSSCQNLTPLYKERIKDNKSKNYNQDGAKKGFNISAGDFD